MKSFSRDEMSVGNGRLRWFQCQLLSGDIRRQGGDRNVLFGQIGAGKLEAQVQNARTVPVKEPGGCWSACGRMVEEASPPV
jgi:hypothetical protein